MVMKKCERQYRLGEHVIYFDEFGRPHDALLTAVHGERTEVDYEGAIRKIEEPCVNLLFLSPDKARKDTYGRQIERRSSCMHTTYNSAWGNSFCLPKEKDKWYARLQEAKDILSKDNVE